MTQRRSARFVISCVVGIVALTALDLGTKEWALEALSEAREGTPPPVCDPDDDGHIYMQRMREGSVVLIDGYLEFRYAENCGAAFGLMRNAPRWLRAAIFGVAAIAASVALMWMFVYGRGGKPFAWAVPFIVSGALGNLIDRIRYGYVVDFIRFHLKDSWEYPTFNVADAAITVGVVLLLIDGVRESRRAAHPRLASSESGSGDVS
jgi:signal peptidase II